MKKVVVNRCFGGFGLSIEAQNLYAKKKGFELFHYTQTKYERSGGIEEYKKIDESSDALFTYSFTKDLGDTISKFTSENYWYYGDIERDDAALVEVVEELGQKANSRFSKLEVVEIPDDICWKIDEYDGMETVEECHRSW